MTWGRNLTEARERRAAEREANMAALCKPTQSLHRGTYAGATAADPKPVERRNAHLLAMAKGMRCLLLVPGVCNHRQDTTVACHSNLSIHGKAGARKADDHYSVWGCSACHAWLDQGPAPAEVKERAFLEAHARQVLAWGGIARYCPWVKDVASAKWALELLKERAAA